MAKRTTDTIGERARSIREKLKLPQVVVAKKAGWHVTDLCNLERGRGPKSPGIERLMELASALGVTVDALLVPGRRGRAGGA